MYIYMSIHPWAMQTRINRILIKRWKRQCHIEEEDIEACMDKCQYRDKRKTTSLNDTISHSRHKLPCLQSFVISRSFVIPPISLFCISSLPLAMNPVSPCPVCCQCQVYVWPGDLLVRIPVVSSLHPGTRNKDVVMQSALPQNLSSSYTLNLCRLDVLSFQSHILLDLTRAIYHPYTSVTPVARTHVLSCWPQEFWETVRTNQLSKFCSYFYVWSRWKVWPNTIIVVEERTGYGISSIWNKNFKTLDHVLSAITVRENVQSLTLDIDSIYSIKAYRAGQPNKKFWNIS